MSKKVKNLKDLISLYAEACVEDMDIADLMKVVYEEIYERMANYQTTDETLLEIKESVYSDILEEAEYECG
jgi:hypothetical protein